jgi:tripartite-type tricarboxylate transporter receptor subunit TctC
MYVDSGGGGYDAIAWLMARHMSHFLPGNPNFVIKNMPTAAGGASANFIYNSAPRPQFALRSPEGTCSLLNPRASKFACKIKGLVVNNNEIYKGRGISRAKTSGVPP